MTRLWVPRRSLAMLLIVLASFIVQGDPSASAATSGGDFVSVPYTRIIDTRTGMGGSSSPFSASETRT